MAKAPSPEPDNRTVEPPAPEVLRPEAEDASEAAEAAAASASKADGAGKRPRHMTYRPSHKATFIALAVVVAILAINAGIIVVVMKAQTKSRTELAKGQVTVNQAALDKLGVNRSPVGSQGVELTVNPNARFNGTVQISGDTSIGGQLKLNNKFSATSASFAQLEAGKTSLSELNVNGDATASSLALRKDLTVTGTSRLQGTVIVSQLLTVTNSVNVTGNLAVGGVLSVNGLHVSTLVIDNTMTVGGHFITQGLAPRVTAGPGVGSNGTVAISGNDIAGTVSVNTGVGASGGILANVTFRVPYSNIPHVVVTAIGGGMGSVYITRNSHGFSIGVNGAIAPGGYAFDFIVQQ